MELKKIIVTIFFVGLIGSARAEMIKPAENLSAYDVIKIQLNALKNNDDDDTWSTRAIQANPRRRRKGRVKNQRVKPTVGLETIFEE